MGKITTSDLIREELKLKKLAKTAWGVPKKIEEGKKPEKFTSSLKMEQVVNIAKKKMEDLGAHELKIGVKQVIGSCMSSGVSVEGKHPKEILKEIDEGKWDEKIKL
ncbi:MAG: hypothetical protein ISS95_00725 [Candidatus Aenigmarchaeota archaeon]|nr:hypothetical protein [Candidatus Aenigmarchaeota archaeon]